MYRLSIYNPFSEWQKGDLLSTPFICLAVGTHTKEAGHTLLSPQLMSDKEIDEVADNLKAELEEFRKKAKRELKTLKAKIG